MSSNEQDARAGTRPATMIVGGEKVVTAGPAPPEPEVAPVAKTMRLRFRGSAKGAGLEPLAEIDGTPLPVVGADGVLTVDAEIGARLLVHYPELYREAGEGSKQAAPDAKAKRPKGE